MGRRVAIVVAALLAVTGAAFAASQKSDGPAKRLLTGGTGTPVNSPGRNREFTCVTGLNFQPGLTKPDRKWIIKTPSRVRGIVVMGKKVYVQGMVRWNSKLKITVTKTKRVFKGNGLPSTPTGAFPVQKNTAAYQYCKGPAARVRHRPLARVPANPEV
jgi:hypothetical protein